jgi:hypothetical protein
MTPFRFFFSVLIFGAAVMLLFALHDLKHAEPVSSGRARENHPQHSKGGGQIGPRRLAIFLNGSLSATALRRTAKVVRFRALAIISVLHALKTRSRSSLSRSGVQGRRGVLFISPSPSAHLQLSRPDFSQNYLHLSGT